MKYGKRERIIGIVVVVALGVIFLPMLFDKPEPEGSSSEPALTIEQPISTDQDTSTVDEPRSPIESDTAPESDPESTGRFDNGSAMLGGSSGGGDTLDGQQLPSPSEQPSEPASESREPDPEPAPQQAPAPSKPTRSDVQTSGQSSAPAPSDAQKNARDEDPILQAARQGSDGSGTPARASENGGWAVQSGSFGKSDNATRLADQLKKKGFPVYTLSRNELTVVLVGPFETNEQAERASTQLQQQANIKGLVVRRKGNE
ncbi:SPOR domain-containing protein [Larsenimonas salina]|uniref:SPOR domain-containing protein n=1 Tax=Larsenimonas salina TaxID=1295565 RepID=UPI0020749B37|nr:SPOR domain-containing protein [Larsenimonas salina]MCM5703540.1 SPOR domain-containing protein [Larsenimonas salina]